MIQKIQNCNPMAAAVQSCYICTMSFVSVLIPVILYTLWMLGEGFCLYHANY